MEKLKERAMKASKILSIMPSIKSILEGSKKVSIEQKEGVGNFVTSVDKQLEKYISENLLQMFPEALVIGEESAEQIKNNQNARIKFIVDPLDGTTNFTNGWPHAVSIGMIEDGELIAGIIYDVLGKKVYTGIKDLGVTESDIDDIKTQRKIIKPTYAQNEIKKSPISYDTPYGKDAYKVTREMSSELYYAGASLKIVGPMALDVLKTALGRENRPTDYNAATWHTEVRPWDLAAATCISRELGGDVINVVDGKPLSIEVLSNPSAKIGFIASGSEQLRNALYEKYKIAEKRVTKNEQVK